MTFSTTASYIPVASHRLPADHDRGGHAVSAWRRAGRLRRRRTR